MELQIIPDDVSIQMLRAYLMILTHILIPTNICKLEEVLISTII